MCILVVVYYRFTPRHTFWKIDFLQVTFLEALSTEVGLFYEAGKLDDSAGENKLTSMVL